jgi:hypothetical protein
MGRSYLNAPRFNAGDIPSLDRRTGAGSPAVMQGRVASGINQWIDRRAALEASSADRLQFYLTFRFLPRYPSSIRI